MQIVQGKSTFDYTYDIYWGLAHPNGIVWPLHREDGPAVIGYRKADNAVLYNIWVKNGKRHRLDGPAYLYWSGGLSAATNTTPSIVEYWINGVEYTKEEFDEYVKGLENKEDKELLGDLGQTFD